MISIVAALALNGFVAVTPPAFAEAMEPQVAIDRDHRVYIAYGLGNALYVSISTDEGATYAKPIKVAELSKLALGMRRGPRIAAHNGVVTISAISHRPGDLVAFKSANRGASWSQAVTVNDAPGSAREGLHAMAAGPDGTLAATWLDLRSDGTKLYLATSKDGGANWSENRLVYASPSGSVCECCHPSVAFDAKGKLVVMFRNSLNGARDMYAADSTDGGQSFATPTKLGGSTWKLDACPMDGGAFAFTPDGGVEAVWRREGTLYRSGVRGAERMFAEGQQAWLATVGEDSYLTWTAGNRILASTPTERVMELSASGKSSVVAASPDGKLVIATWTESGIRAARLR